MEDALMVAGVIALGLVWLVLHYVTKWRHAPKITHEDENLLDEMYILARRLEERVQTVERIVAADHPDFRSGLNASGPDYRSSLGGSSATYQIDRRN